MVPFCTPLFPLPTPSLEIVRRFVFTLALLSHPQAGYGNSGYGQQVAQQGYGNYAAQGEAVTVRVWAPGFDNMASVLSCISYSTTILITSFTLGLHRRASWMDSPATALGSTVATILPAAGRSPAEVMIARYLFLAHPASQSPDGTASTRWRNEKDVTLRRRLSTRLVLS